MTYTLVTHSATAIYPRCNMFLKSSATAMDQIFWAMPKILVVFSTVCFLPTPALNDHRWCAAQKNLPMVHCWCIDQWPPSLTDLHSHCLNTKAPQEIFIGGDCLQNHISAVGNNKDLLDCQRYRSNAMPAFAFCIFGLILKSSLTLASILLSTLSPPKDQFADKLTPELAF